MKSSLPSSSPKRPNGFLYAMVIIIVLLCGTESAFAFNDDFEDGNISDWSTRCGGWQFVAGFGGGLAIASTQTDNVLVHSSFSGGYGHYHYDVNFPDNPIADGDLFFQIIGSNGYWILLGPDNSDNGSDRIIRVSNGGVGSQAGIGCTAFHLTRLIWHRIDIYRFPNGVIQVFMDNEATPRMQAFNTTTGGSGSIALRAVAPGVKFDNVSFDAALPANPPVPSASSCATWGGLDPSCAVGPPGPDPGSGSWSAPAMGGPALMALATLLILLGLRSIRARRPAA